MAAVCFLIPVKTDNAANRGQANSKFAAMMVSRRHAAEHRSACVHTMAALARAGVRPHAIVPAVVTLTRVSSGHMDEHDGLRSALKWVVDGIAEALGIDDGGSAVSWKYAQRKGPAKFHAVHVRIEKAELR